MHLALAIRGSDRDVRRFLDEIQAKYVNYHNDGVTNIVWRPYVLGELIFPESALQTVLATLEPVNWKRDIPGQTALRKLLKMDKVPSHDGKTPGLPVWKYNFEVKLIGVKTDRFVDGKEKI